MQRARFWTLANMQDFAFLHIKYAWIKALYLITLFVEGTKCKILHICTCARIFIPAHQKVQVTRHSVFVTPYMQGAKSNILHICIHARLWILAHINVQVPRHYVFIIAYMQGAKWKILHICTRARFCILAHQKCGSSKT